MKGKVVIERNMFYGAKRRTFLKAYELRKNETDTEKKLWEYLNDRKIFKYRFKRQHPIDIFIVDFYCHRLKLAIEVDGEIHQKPEKQTYDEGRSFDIEKFGIQILRFSNEEIIEEIDNVIEKIKKEIGFLSPL
jgi:very-short-patch-repair endonuclease